MIFHSKWSIWSQWFGHCSKCSSFKTTNNIPHYYYWMDHRWIKMMRFGKYLLGSWSESIFWLKSEIYVLSVGHHKCIMRNGKRLNLYFRYFSCSPFEIYFAKEWGFCFIESDKKFKMLQWFSCCQAIQFKIDIGDCNGIANAKWYNIK